ncbi:MAG: helix-turn-helix transcriptional regulator [Solimonas sp.]
MSSVHAHRAVIDDSALNPVLALQSAIDLESFWGACVSLVGQRLPHRSCSLMFDIVDFEPNQARHHVVQPRNPGYVPATSLTISGPFLARHPQINLYTYSQIVSEDPDAHRRRLVQEPEPEWNEFVHLAFWDRGRPEAVLSIHRPPDRSSISDDERTFLEQLHPMVDAGLRRLRALDREWTRRAAYENFLRRMPLSVMFAGIDGRLLFATPEAERQCERWNRGLLNTTAGSLPEALPAMLKASDDERLLAAGLSSAFVSIAHPRLPGLAVRVERGWQNPALRLHPYYALSFVDERGADSAPDALSQAALALLQQLSPSEQRVALMVTQGLRNEEIAQRLSRSRRTIEFQLNSIYRKLQINGRTQLVRALA